MDINISGVTAKHGGDIEHRISMLLWGQAGCGKTTLAATAPGNKLWLNFDDNGTSSIAARDDVYVADFSDQPDSVVPKFKQETAPMIVSLDKNLRDNPDVTTLVVDSITSFGMKALSYGVIDASKSGATLEDPGFKGFGRKNTWTRYMVKQLLRLSAKHGKHIIFVAHEDVPSKDSEGGVAFISLMLGSNLAQEVPVDHGEVWHMQDTGKARLIRVRPDGFFRPMKTRMFQTNGPARFKWQFNPETLEGEGIATWYQRWKDNNYRKIAVPQ
jgi:hypothetical protein